VVKRLGHSGADLAGILVECPDGSHSGPLLELGWDGVRLELPDGEMPCLRPGSVRQLRAE
jgi:hypothetical protein